jgi:hypothetical protein
VVGNCRRLKSLSGGCVSVRLWFCSSDFVLILFWVCSGFVLVLFWFVLPSCSLLDFWTIKIDRA